MNYSSCERLLSVVADGVADQSCIPPGDFADACDLAEGESIALLATAESAGLQISLFFCEAPEEEPGFVLVYQGADDLLLDYAGPFSTFTDAQKAAGVPAEDWFDC